MGGERKDVSLQQVDRHSWPSLSPSSLFLGERRCASDSVPSRQPSDTLESRGGKQAEGSVAWRHPLYPCWK